MVCQRVLFMYPSSPDLDAVNCFMWAVLGGRKFSIWI
uniref:Uncharacterized protein n=1 Tax=Anguilla anguilla TaxID=7936 RepID=A0A0E9UB86_ANGAN